MSAPPPETVALARRRYAEGARVDGILLETRLSLTAFYRCLDGVYDDGSGARPRPLPRRRNLAKAVGELMQDRSAIAARLWRAAEGQVRDIEKRLRRGGIAPPQRERDTRVLAVLVRTLRELSDFDAQARGGRNETAEDDCLPRNLDDLRRELSRRLDGMAAAAPARIPEDAERG